MNNSFSSNKSIGLQQNVTIRVLDKDTGRVVSEHQGHNSATDTLLTGIGKFLIGNGVFEQGYDMLRNYIPQYISLGTMGLISQEADENGLPKGIGVTVPDTNSDEYKELKDALDSAQSAYDALSEDCKYLDSICDECPLVLNQIPKPDTDPVEYYSCPIREQYQEAEAALLAAQQALNEWWDSFISEESKESRYKAYMNQRPGYGADGYDANANNHRPYFGLGPDFDYRPYPDTPIMCELVTDDFPRAKISFRDVVPEVEAELPETIDVVFSAFVSTGALKKFRGTGNNYIFITEAGLWATDKVYRNANGTPTGEGLLAAYRIVPTDKKYWDHMDEPEAQEALERSIIRVGLNQVVQVIWKIQVGRVDQFGISGADPRITFSLIDNAEEDIHNLLLIEDGRIDGTDATFVLDNNGMNIEPHSPLEGD